MSTEALEVRVSHLESEVRALREELAKIQSRRGWRRTVGVFADDPGFWEIVRLGAEERALTRRETASD